MKKAQKNKEPKIKRNQIFEIVLTKYELLHLRDLMGILMPPDGQQTLSQALAVAEDRALIESMLWEKLTNACKLAKLPLADEAPDYIIAPITTPALGVFQVNHELEDENEEEGEGFLPDEDLGKDEEE